MYNDRYLVIPWNPNGGCTEKLGDEDTKYPPLDNLGCCNDVRVGKGRPEVVLEKLFREKIDASVLPLDDTTLTRVCGTVDDDEAAGEEVIEKLERIFNFAISSSSPFDRLHASSKAVSKFAILISFPTNPFRASSIDTKNCLLSLSIDSSNCLTENFKTLISSAIFIASNSMFPWAEFTILMFSLLPPASWSNRGTPSKGLLGRIVFRSDDSRDTINRDFPCSCVRRNSLVASSSSMVGGIESIKASGAIIKSCM